MDLIKITPDKEKARSIIKMIELIEERIPLQEKDKIAALILSDYYEIIKELITAILLSDEYKTLSHKDLIDSLKERQKELSENEISLIDSLRILRNRITYEGFQTNKDYLTRNEPSYKSIITKLKSIIKTKLKCQ